MFGAEKHAVEIDGKDVAPFLERGFDNGAEVADARVVDKYVETAELAFDLLHDAQPLRFGCHIQDYSAMVSTSFSQCIRASRQLVSGTIGENDDSAFHRKPFRWCLADSRSSAGDECDLSYEAPGRCGVHRRRPSGSMPTIAGRQIEQIGKLGV